MSGARIDTITIYDFQGFPGVGVSPIKLDGDNLLIYGENGSGKSTIFTALSELLNPRSRKIFDGDVERATCLKHRFSDATSQEGIVALDFKSAEGGAVIGPMVWPISQSRPTDHPYYASMSRSSGFLDYRAILRTHFLDYENDSINLFSLVVETLLRDVEFLTSTQTYGQEWEAIQKDRNYWSRFVNTSLASIDDFTRESIDFDPSQYSEDDLSDSDALNIDDDKAWNEFLKEKYQGLEKRINTFSENLTLRLSEIETLANKYLGRFDRTLKIVLGSSMLYIPVEEELLWEDDWNSSVRLRLQATFRGELLSHPGVLLNEARLTAIALTLYLAALRAQTPASVTAPRLLVLDDVLIGLDMAHRLPILDLLKSEFSKGKGWQVLLFTYDLAWYEIAKQRIQDGWVSYELFSVREGNYEQPLLKPDVKYLDKAIEFLCVGEVKAAAVHIRAEFELVVKGACEQFGVPIKYRPDLRRTAISEFWNALKSYEWEHKQPAVTGFNKKGQPYTQPEKTIGVQIIKPGLATRIDHAVSWILNSLSHSSIVAYYRSEIADAITAIIDLQARIDELSDKALTKERCTLVATVIRIREERLRQEQTTS